MFNRIEKSASVYLAVVGKRHCRKPSYECGKHISRQKLCYKARKLLFLTAAGIEKKYALLVVIVKADRAADRIVLHSGRVYLAKLYAVTHMLYLRIATANEDKLAVLVISANISRAIKKLGISGIRRILHKDLCGLFVRVVISHCKAGAANTYLALVCPYPTRSRSSPQNQ